MISELTIERLGPQIKEAGWNRSFDYIFELPFFKRTSSIKFGPGINLVIGPNGSGKSSILKMLATYLAAESGGRSFVTSSWLRSQPSKSFFSVRHDGNPIQYCDTNHDIGLIGGSAAFDDDFFDEGIRAIQRKASSGLSRIDRMRHVVLSVMKNTYFPDTIKGNVPFTLADTPYLVGSIPAGPRTVIIDEPESALTFKAQKGAIENFVSGARKHGYQLIMATHSPFALQFLADDDVTVHCISEDILFDIEASMLFVELGEIIQKKMKQTLDKTAERHAPKNDKSD